MFFANLINQPTNVLDTALTAVFVVGSCTLMMRIMIAQSRYWEAVLAAVVDPAEILKDDAPSDGDAPEDPGPMAALASQLFPFGGWPRLRESLIREQLGFLALFNFDSDKARVRRLLMARQLGDVLEGIPNTGGENAPWEENGENEDAPPPPQEQPELNNQHGLPANHSDDESAVRLTTSLRYEQSDIPVETLIYLMDKSGPDVKFTAFGMFVTRLLRDPPTIQRIAEDLKSVEDPQRWEQALTALYKPTVLCEQGYIDPTVAYIFAYTFILPILRGLSTMARMDPVKLNAHHFNCAVTAMERFHTLHPILEEPQAWQHSPAAEPALSAAHATTASEWYTPARRAEHLATVRRKFARFARNYRKNLGRSMVPMIPVEQMNEFTMERNLRQPQTRFCMLLISHEILINNLQDLD